MSASQPDSELDAGESAREARQAVENAIAAGEYAVLVVFQEGGQLRYQQVSIGFDLAVIPDIMDSLRGQLGDYLSRAGKEKLDGFDSEKPKSILPDPSDN